MNKAMMQTTIVATPAFDLNQPISSVASGDAVKVSVIDIVVHISLVGSVVGSIVSVVLLDVG